MILLSQETCKVILQVFCVYGNVAKSLVSIMKDSANKKVCEELALKAILW